jgi:hypothetical protein
VNALANKFFQALEDQSQTPDLAEGSQLELKKLVLMHSRTWGAVMAREHQTISGQKAALDELRQAYALLEKDRDAYREQAQDYKAADSVLESTLETSRHTIEAARDEAELLRQRRAELEQQKATLETELETSRHTIQTARDEAALLRQRGAELEQEKAALESELEKSRARIEAAGAEMASLDEELAVWEQSTADLAFELSRLRQQTRVRAGLRLGIVREPGGFPVSQNREESGAPDDGECLGTESDCSPKAVQDGRWQLWSAPGNTARLVPLPGVDETLRIAILARIHFGVGGHAIAVELSSVTLIRAADGQLIQPA